MELSQQLRQRIIQSIEGERYYQACSEWAGREDELRHRLGELASGNAQLLDPENIDPIINEWREWHGIE